MPRLGFAFFLVVSTLLLVLANRYAFRWVVRAFEPSPGVRRALAGVLVASVLALFVGRLADFADPDAPVRTVIIVASTVQLAVWISVVALLVADAGLLLLRWISKLKAGARKPPQVDSPVVADPAPAPGQNVSTLRGDDRERALPSEQEAAVPALTRRVFLERALAGSAFLIGSSSSLYGALAGRHDYSLEEVPVKIPGLPKALDGFSIVQLSDVHIGRFVGTAELAAAEDLVRRARPDLIVMTGDLVDHDARLAFRLGEFAARLRPLARHGVAAVSGNHDFFAGIQPVVKELERGGAQVLRNRGLTIGDGSAAFALLGVDDVWARRRGGGPDLARAIDSLPDHRGSSSRARDLPRVLLCHNPSYFEEASEHVALQLSGHTHGGQINLVVRPADWVLKNGWVAGSYFRDGGELYVNRGFGTVGPPARIGAPPEVTRIVLVAA